MMNTQEYAGKIVEELKSTLEKVDPIKSNILAEKIINANKIFVAGQGRSGFAVKSFAMRLMHIGYDVYVVGETVTPNIEKGDLLIIGSGSGETATLTVMANKAKYMGADLVLVTIFPESTIGKISDIVVKISAPTPKVAVDNGFKSIQPMGSLFEQSLLIYLDSIVLTVMEKSGKTSNDMFTRHANLE